MNASVVLGLLLCLHNCEPQCDLWYKITMIKKLNLNVTLKDRQCQMDVMLWWVDLSWLPDPLALSLPFLNKAGREKKMAELVG